VKSALMTQTNDKRARVVGLGLTGLSCVRYLVRRGFNVSVTDTRDTPPMLLNLKREFPSVPVHTGVFTDAMFADADLLVVSPGVPTRAGPIADAIANGLVAVGDVELFAREAKAPVLAITGANGKSTVTTLAGDMCRAAGLKTLVGGNIGVPVLDLLNEPVPDAYVLELSSFQLETTCSLNAKAAVVLNITPDHMDRYASLRDYADAKARIFQGTGAMVLNADDPTVAAMADSKRETIFFGLGTPKNKNDFGVQTFNGEEWIVRGDTRLFLSAEISLPGRHNISNVLAALALTSVLGVNVRAQCQAVREFKGLAHRTQIVAERDGVCWVDDSKGTNVGATVAALNGMTRKVVLIAGGDGKGQNFGELKAAVARRARAVVLIGRDAPAIERALQNAVPVRHAKDMGQAVAACRALAQPGDAVLLSPACASFDMFRNYEHRGDVFADEVRKLLA
jgi:UDP-N-acetylmuramoylalanine--D-glutamate ligase